MFIILTIISAMVMAINLSLAFTYESIQVMTERKWTYLKWATLLYFIVLIVSLTSIGGAQTAGAVSIWGSPLAVLITTMLMFEARSWQYIVVNTISLISGALLTYMVIFAPRQFTMEMVKGTSNSLSMISVSFSVVMPLLMAAIAGITAVMRSFSTTSKVDFGAIQKALKVNYDSQMTEIQASKKSVNKTNQQLSTHDAMKAKRKAQKNSKKVGK